MSHRRCLVSLLAVAVQCLGLTACGADAPPPIDPPRPVAITKALVMAPNEGVRVTGVAEPYREAELAFEVTGRVTAILDVGRSVQVYTSKADDGQLVTRGEVVAEMDTTTYQQRYDGATLKLKTAQAGLKALMIDVEQVAPATVARAKAQRDAALSDVEAARAGVESAESAKRTAEADLERNRPLLREKRISPAEFDQYQKAFDTAAANQRKAEAGLKASQDKAAGSEAAVVEAEGSIRLKVEKVAEANAQIAELELAVEQAQTDLDRCVLHAPFAGRITYVYASQGDLVTAGTPVVRLTLIDPIKVSATVSADLERRIQPGHHARVTPRNFADYDSASPALFGTVFEKGAVADPATRTFRIDVMVRNARRRLQEAADPKVTRVEFRQLLPAVERHHGEGGPLFICRDCIVEQDGGTFVYRLRGAKFGQPRPDGLFARTLPLERIPVQTDPKTTKDFMQILNWTFQQATPVAGALEVQDGDLLLACDRLDPHKIDFDSVVLERYDWAIRPGDLVPITFEGQPAPEGIWLPDAAIVANAGVRTIYVVEGTTARAIQVSVHESKGRLRRVEAADLEEGAAVVIVGAQYLFDGATVSITREVELSDWIGRRQ